MTQPAQDTFDILLESAPPHEAAHGKAEEAAAIVEAARELFARLEQLGDDETAMDTINALRAELHRHSPMRDQPVDCVLWVPADQVTGNDYNPNVVAKPELELLARSITADGYTQPVVAYATSPDSYEIVDGFHRSRVGTENRDIAESVQNRLPLTLIKPDRTAREDRQVATVRHNRARGLHTVDGMSDIVIDLHQRNWSDERIGQELGMEGDEVLKLRQLTSMATAFADGEFSEAWEPSSADPFAS